MLRHHVYYRSLQETLRVQQSLFGFSSSSIRLPTFSRDVRPPQPSNRAPISAIACRNYSFKSLLDDMSFESKHLESLKSQRNNKQSFERSPRRNGTSEHSNTKNKHGNRDHRHGIKSKFDLVNRYQSVSNDVFLDLENRSIQHKNSFPSDADDNKAVLHWHSSAVELIMELTKLWGKNRGSNQVSPDQVSRGIVLADELMTRILDNAKSELEREMKHTKELHSANPSPRLHMQGKQKQSKELDMEICCQMIALGWSRCDPNTVSRLNAPRKAQAILESLEEICQMYDRLPMSATRQFSFTRHSVTPTNRLCNHVLSCWSRSSDPNAEDQAIVLLNRMASDSAAYPKPDTISYNNLLHLYANKGDVEKAEILLKQMEDPNLQISPSLVQFPTDREIKADVFSYSIVINALRKRFVSSGNNRDINDPVRAEKIVQEMVKKGIVPNEVCFSTVLSMYASIDRQARDEIHEAKSRKWKDSVSTSNTLGYGAENAERVLSWILSLYERDAQDGKSVDVKINAQNFTTVIDAWAKAGKGVEGAMHCERLCDTLVSLYEKSGFDYLRPRPEVRFVV